MMNALERFLMTASCRDTDSIPKVPHAGRVAIVDGLIVASFFPCDHGLAFPDISRNQAAMSLFR